MLLRSYSARWILGAIVFTAVLGVLRHKPWRRDDVVSGSERESLQVGFLPVTCHLTCPVTDFATRTSRGARFESKRFSDFPTMVESMKAGRLQATFITAPLAMKLREQGLPVRILYLGHRDGSEVMVRKDLQATSLRDLRGKVFAIPSKYSNQYLVINRLLEEQRIDRKKIQFVEMPPHALPAALPPNPLHPYFLAC